MTKPRKPRTLRMRGKWDTFFCVPYGESAGIEDALSRFVVSTPNEARKLADWLNRWADWRDAKESEEER